MRCVQITYGYLPHNAIYSNGREHACCRFYREYVVGICSRCNYVLLGFEILRVSIQDLTLQCICLLLIFWTITNKNGDCIFKFACND